MGGIKKKDIITLCALGVILVILLTFVLGIMPVRDKIKEIKASNEQISTKLRSIESANSTGKSRFKNFSKQENEKKLERDNLKKIVEENVKNFEFIDDSEIDKFINNLTNRYPLQQRTRNYSRSQGDIAVLNLTISNAEGHLSFIEKKSSSGDKKHLLGYRIVKPDDSETKNLEVYNRIMNNANVGRFGNIILKDDIELYYTEGETSEFSANKIQERNRKFLISKPTVMLDDLVNYIRDYEINGNKRFTVTKYNISSFVEDETEDHSKRIYITDKDGKDDAVDKPRVRIIPIYMDKYSIEIECKMQNK